MKTTDDFYLSQSEPQQSCFIALRDIILSQSKEITHAMNYGMPFFYYNGKRFCYLWFHKKIRLPYIGIVEGKYFDEPFLIQEHRSRMKIMLINPNEDLPLATISTILQKALEVSKLKKATSNK